MLSKSYVGRDVHKYAGKYIEKGPEGHLSIWSLGSMVLGAEEGKDFHVLPSVAQSCESRTAL